MIRNHALLLAAAVSVMSVGTGSPVAPFVGYLDDRRSGPRLTPKKSQRQRRKQQRRAGRR
jgi:hypothetical protein